MTAELARQPPLVFAGECDQLKDRLAAVARGEAFVLQGGDCAETFAGSTADAVRNKLKTLLQMAVVLTYAASVPVVKIGRMAGQFAKPRSRRTETRDGVELPSYRGDAVNGFDFTPEARRARPGAAAAAPTTASAVTLNLCRAFTKGGYADLRQVHAWNQDFVAQSPAGRRYEQLAGEIDRALSFMKACGADSRGVPRGASSTQATRRSSWSTSARSPASTAAPDCPTTSPPTWCGSASAPGT